MEHDLSDAIDFILQHLALGFSELHIRQHFANHGWPPEWIDRAFYQLEHPLGLQSPSAHAEAPQRYTIIRSLSDAWQAVRHNTQAYVVALIGSYLITFLLAFVISWLSVRLILTHFVFSPFASIIGFYLEVFTITMVIDVVIYALGGSFIVATTGRALADGHAKRRSNIRRLAEEGLRKLWHMFKVTFVSYLITFWPLALLLSMPFIVSFNSIYTLIGLCFGVFAIAWIIIASLRLALTQQVSLFEPELSIKQAMKRSSYLLRDGGQWFVAKGAALIILIYILLTFGHTSPFLLLFINSSRWVWLVVGVLSQVSLLMLYLNRAAVRGKSH